MPKRTKSPDLQKWRRFAQDGSLLGAIGNRVRHRIHGAPAFAGKVQSTCDQDVIVASYNVHKCVGIDNKFDPKRIAAVIAELGADVVAVQEADQRFGKRHGLLDLNALKRNAGLELVPVAGSDEGHGWHGNALLLREGQARRIRRLDLPGAEPRGAIIVDLELASGPLRIIATHLGLLRRSRGLQVETIIEAFMQSEAMPTLLLGDLNEWRPGHRSSLHGLRPVFGPLPGGLPSFPSRMPLLALDRVIGSPGLITALEVHETPLSRIASDHLPLKAQIRIANALEHSVEAQAAAG